MDSNLFVCQPKAIQLTSSPLFVSCRASILGKSCFFNKPKLNLYVKSCSKSSFMGKDLSFGRNEYGYCKIRKTDVPVSPIIRNAVKRRKEIPFDTVIQRDKKLKLCLKIRKILISQPDRAMPLRELGKYRRQLGLQRGRRFIALLKKFPGVFEIEEEGAYLLRLKLTPEAERLYFEELKIRNGMEELLVVKLRKLLMMTLDKRVLLEKISHLRTDLGLPLEFRDTICRRYPQYFKVVHTPQGQALELTHWDSDLAVSAAELAEEDNKTREFEEKNLIIDRPLKFNKVALPKGLNLSKSEMRKISQFRDIPYISPYSDFSNLQQGSKEKEKHACAVIHEILSLTVERRTLVDHLTHFRDEFRFSQQLRGMLIRHPDMFYVSLKGDRDSVFLREAYRGSQLVDKDRLLIVKEKMRALVDVPRFKRRGVRESNDGSKETDEKKNEDSEGEEDDDDDDDWSDIDNAMSEGDEYNWSDDDDDDETPPEFEEDNDVKMKVRPVKEFDHLPNIADDVPVVFPDGRPRERW